MLVSYEIRTAWKKYSVNCSGLPKPVIGVKFRKTPHKSQKFPDGAGPSSPTLQLIFELIRSSRFRYMAWETWRHAKDTPATLNKVEGNQG